MTHFATTPGAPLTRDAVPSLWRILLFRIAQSERRDRIWRDWEEHVFGFRIARDRLRSRRP
jgi:hypothetical protein